MFLRQLFQCKFLTVVLLLGSSFYTATGRAEVWADVRNNVITNNGVFDCTECHSYQKTNETNSVAPTPTPSDYRHGAPISANFDGINDLTAYNNTATVSANFGVQVDDGTAAFQAGTDYNFADNSVNYIYEWMAILVDKDYMPMDPTADANADGVTENFIATTALIAAKKTLLKNWALQGAPFAAPSATTDDAPTSITKLSAVVRGDFDTNVHSGTAVPGTYYFEYGTTTGYGSSTSVSNRSSTSTLSNTTKSISGLNCGTLYHYRARATNGSATGVSAAAGVDRTFTTLSCSDPVIAGATVTIVADATSQSTNEDTFKDFSLTVTNSDPGSLQWSKTNGAKGAVSLSGATNTAFSGSATVRYTPTADLFGPDSFTVTVSNMNTGTFQTVTFNMTVNGINDQPAFAPTSTPSTSAIEDIQYTYQVEIDDADDSFLSGLSVALSNKPAGMLVDANGLVTWAPANGVASSGLVTVSVDDGHENGTVQINQQFTVLVSGTNDPPVITPGATTTATEDVQYSYQMQVTDIDDTNNGTDIKFTLIDKPLNMLVSSTGLITWTPLEGVTTSGLVTIEVEDGDEDLSKPADSESFTITVTSVNDSPVVTPGAPTAANEEDSYNYQIIVNDDDDDNNGSDLSFTPSNFPLDMAVSPTGLITWAVPRTGADITHNTITVTVADGGQDGATTSAEVFNLAVSIVDTDSDTVADYSDNCPAVANTGQEDLDNDTVRILPQTDPNNFPPEGDVDPTATDPVNILGFSYLKGGDVCDKDIDGDGLSNDFENMFTFLDPMNATDAAADEDGDGVSNLDEFLASTAPDVDSVGPTVNAPPDITINATGLLTVVDLGTATGSDGNDGTSTLFKAAVNLTQVQKDDLAIAISGCQLFSDYETDIEPFRPGEYVVTWATCDSSGNSGQDDQVVNVKPLVSVNSGQSVGEGQPVSVNVVLNGNAISYPATVEYTITGTAAAIDDHDAVAGTVNFASAGDVGVINFNTVTDGVTVGDASEGDETVVITLHTPSKIALGNANVHTVTITEANVAPQVALSVSQPAAVLDKNKGNTLYTADGAAKIVASAIDGNGDVLSFDWSATDNTLLALATITGNQIDIDPNLLTTGSFYKVAVTVSDGVTPVTVERLLLVKAGEVNVWLVGADADGDGKLNVLEGYGDDDADGIPNYIDSHSTPPNAIENQTVNLETSVYIETDPGLKIAMGETAIAAQASGVLIGMQDIIDHGGAAGTAVVNAATNHVFFSGLLNFEISGLTGDVLSANVVIPLSSAIQADAVYRKYNNSGWFDFVEDDLNALGSAAGNDGTCPQPGSNLYSAGLTPGHLCLQLTIQDGGANDADGVRNFVIKDPGGLALEPASDVVAAPSDASGRVGSVGLWFMLILSITAAAVWRLRVRAAVNTAGCFISGKTNRARQTG